MRTLKTVRHRLAWPECTPKRVPYVAEENVRSLNGKLFYILFSFPCSKGRKWKSGTRSPWLECQRNQKKEGKVEHSDENVKVRHVFDSHYFPLRFSFRRPCFALPSLQTYNSTRLLNCILRQFIDFRALLSLVRNTANSRFFAVHFLFACHQKMLFQQSILI